MDVGKSDKFCLSSVRTSESGLGLGRTARRVANWVSSESGSGGTLTSSLLLALAIVLPIESGRKRLR